MIHLEHVNLVVRNITASLAFYQAAFPHWTVRGGGKGTWYGKPRNWIHFGDDYQYLAFNDDGEADNRDLTGHQVGLAHFAFVTHDLDGLCNRLEKAGFNVDKDGASDPYRRNVYFIDPDGFEVEFVQYLTDQPNERNNYNMSS
ncbi:VOC family protein [Shewanella mesophila]|uniref:VOC family protein n=1 Tax=Shewanella mesophila TaxID=2864208 RepID=UPI001C660812|nr:VOC family protein [Shewanella mesophila]QYJ85419.1 VOC family protein [Shewanella mesophila]